MLGQHIKPFKWFGMLFVMLGLVVVGVTDILYDDDPHSDKNAIITGQFCLFFLGYIPRVLTSFSSKKNV